MTNHVQRSLWYIALLAGGLIIYLPGLGNELVFDDSRLDIGDAVLGQYGSLLELIGRKRGAVMTGGHVNMQKAAELVITDYRTHALGRITLETPEEFAEWAAIAAIADAERLARKEALAKAKKKKRKPR